IENTQVAGVESTSTFIVKVTNDDTIDATIEISGFFVTGTTKTMYAQEVFILAVGGVFTNNYFAQFDAFEFQFITSSDAVEISAWGKDAVGNLVAAHRVLPAELDPIGSQGIKGATGAIGETGATGETGAIGETGAAGVMADTMGCFAVNQLANILAQMITAYPTTTWTVFSSSLASYSGVPLDLYSSPNATGPGILRLTDVNNDYEALPIANITAVYPGDGTVYDPTFTYLTSPDPLSPGCDTNMIAAIQSYLPLGTSVDIRLGPAIVASGDVYRNEYGVLVLSDADGNTPIFIATPHILRIFTEDDPTVMLMPRVSNQRPVITNIQSLSHVDQR
ncbi:MAG TPA: collagen-like protein, partial [Desulfosporosinus sp.]|nr:collagen-like protein [Desulfosporosinus sp.]